MVLRKPAEVNPIAEIEAIGKIECGEEAAKHFAFEKGYRNLNHGSFGASPTMVQDVRRYFEDQTEANPDRFLRYVYPNLLDESRAALAQCLNAPLETIVLVSNATTAINTVLRNLVFQPGDVIIQLPNIYGACGLSVSYITTITPAERYKLEYKDPISDDKLCALFEDTIQSIKREGKNPKLAIFDTIVALPGIRSPFERLTALCRAHGVLSYIDGAHSVGHIPMDLTALDPDFYSSNCHKWLHVPRACAVLYVPARNQHLLPSTVPTSHGYVAPGAEALINPLPTGGGVGRNAFVNNFGFVGTLDNSPYLCVPAAFAWRRKLAWGDLRGEEAAMAYCRHVARVGGDAAARVLGTEVMENEDGTLRDCAFANVRLPIASVKDAKTYLQVVRWAEKVLYDEYRTFIASKFDDGVIWVRLSGQVYLTPEDFEWAGHILKEVSARVENGEWKPPTANGT